MNKIISYRSKWNYYLAFGLDYQCGMCSANSQAIEGKILYNFNPLPAVVTAGNGLKSCEYVAQNKEWN